MAINMSDYTGVGIGENALLQLTNRLRINALNSRELTTRLWYVVCALRGPDSNDNVLKSKFTGPIRAWVSKDWNLAIGSTTNSKVFSLLEFVALREEVDKLINAMELKKLRYPRQPSPHYLEHVGLALNVIISFERHQEMKSRDTE